MFGPGCQDRVPSSAVIRAVVTSDGVRGAAASVASLPAPVRSTTPKCGSIEFSPDGQGDRWSDFLPVVQARPRRNDQYQNQRRAFLERVRASPSLAVNSMRPKLVHAYLHADISQAIKPQAIARLNKLRRLVTDSAVRNGGSIKCRVPVTSMKAQRPKIPTAEPDGPALPANPRWRSRRSTTAVM
jgi:hypothetical protein